MSYKAPKCKVPGCNDDVRSKGYCAKHYTQSRKGAITIELGHHEIEVDRLNGLLEDARKELIEERERAGTDKLIEEASDWKGAAEEWNNKCNEYRASFFAEQKVHAITEQAKIL